MIITLFHRCNKRLCYILGIFAGLILFVLINVSSSSLCELLKQESSRVRLLTECLSDTRPHLKLLVHGHDRVHPTDGLAHLRAAHRMLHEFFRTVAFSKVVFNAEGQG